MKGIGASPGIAIGVALVLKKEKAKITGTRLQTDDEFRSEQVKFQNAIDAAVTEIDKIKKSVSQDDGSVEILEVQIELLQDEQIKQDVIAKIISERKNANDAVIEVIQSAAETFRNMDDEYFSARAADVLDAGDRILKNLNEVSQSLSTIVEKNTIIIAEDILPSDTITMDISKIKGFATQSGGKTSHAAIIAKTRGIPAVVGCGNGLNSIQTNDTVIIDGDTGFVFVHPSEEMIAEYEQKQKKFLERIVLLHVLKNIPARTTDGFEIKLLANISYATDLEESFEFGSEGSGLFRTEFLFMDRNSLPGEEEQFIFYKNISQKAKGKPIIVRTLDIGGDKQLPYLDLPFEQNPFLGYRAIRISLDKQDIFITQLRAILRASVYGDLRIMLPMISSIDEIIQAKKILENVKGNLSSQNISFNKEIKLGIMVEIPSAAIIADILAPEVDFFSIGTNDLCQYTLAVDRMNEKVKYLYDPFNPGVLRLIENTIRQGKKYHHHVGMCGELAGDPLATLLLLGMGLTEFSMSAASIPEIKNIIINTSIANAQDVYLKAMAMKDSKTITAYLQEQIKR